MAKKLNIKHDKRFRPPTIQEIEEYAHSKNYDIDAMHFYKYYNDRAWMRHNGLRMEPIRNWKLSIIIWRNKDIQNGTFKPWPPKDSTEIKDDVNNLIEMYEQKR